MALQFLALPTHQPLVQMGLVTWQILLDLYLVVFQLHIQYWTNKCKCLSYSKKYADYRNTQLCSHMDALTVKLKGSTRTDSKSTQQYAHLGTIPYRSSPLILPVLNCHQFLHFFSVALYAQHALVLHDCEHFSWLKTFSWFTFCNVVIWWLFRILKKCHQTLRSWLVFEFQSQLYW